MSSEVDDSPSADPVPSTPPEEESPAPQEAVSSPDADDAGEDPESQPESSSTASEDEGPKHARPGVDKRILAREPSGKPLVVMRELTKSFLHMGRALEVLKGIDLEIHEGEIVAIVGKSGAGKSTLLQCIGTLDMPSTGVIRLGDDYLVGLSRADLAHARNRMIGFVFQFHHLLPEFNALENVMMPGLIQGLPRSTVEKRATELLTDVGLSHRVTHRPGELSGGEQQRVALARALLLKPKLILADEPTGNLDTATSDAIHNLFFEINEKHGTTIVVVTHNNKLAESMPRMITMLDGKVQHDTGPPPTTFDVDEAVMERSRALAKVRYAGFWNRAGARIIDGLLLGLVGIAAFIAIVIFRTGLLSAPPGPKPPDFIGALAPMLHPLVFVGIVAGSGLLALVAQGAGEWGGRGATLGKLMFGLRVRMENLDEPRPMGAILRNVLVIVDGLFLGLVAFLGIRSSLLRQRFGDGLAQTVVVESKTVPADSVATALKGLAIGLVATIALHAAFAAAVAAATL